MTSPSESVYWTVHFEFGESMPVYEDGPGLVRCVASAPPPPGTPEGRYVVNVAENTVTDTRTTLVWQRTETRFVEAASVGTQCTGVWRLPTVKELLTIVDPTRAAPSTNPVFRGATAGDEASLGMFWSRSTDARSGARLIVYFIFGHVERSSSQGSTRCVR